MFFEENEEICFWNFLTFKDPTLGAYKSDLTPDDGFVRSDWIDKMNGCGKRKYPKVALEKDMEVWEAEFEKFHETSIDGLQRCEGVTKILIEKLSQMFPSYPRQMFKKFIMCKTMNRVRWIQQNERKKKDKNRESLRSKTRRLAFQY